jgi:hypothetical protein
MVAVGLIRLVAGIVLIIAEVGRGGARYPGSPAVTTGDDDSAGTAAQHGGVEQ